MTPPTATATLTPARTAGSGEDAAAGADRVLTDAVNRIASLDVDALADADIHDLLTVLEVTDRRLAAVTTRLVGVLESRAVTRAVEDAPQDGRAGTKARRRLRAELGHTLDWEPSRTRATAETARALRHAPTLADAAANGRLSPRHTRVLTDTLRHLDTDQRAAAETELLDAAQTQDPVTFRATCRRLLARLDAEAFEDAETARHRRRYARTAQGEDGLTHLHAGFTGLDAETVLTAIDCFRRPDLDGQPRTPDQRTADALVAGLRHAIDHHAQPGRARPHVSIAVTYDQLRASAGLAEATWTGPIPTRQLRRVLDASTISRVITGPNSLPIDIGRASRHVPAGVWRAIVARDTTCTWQGCDTPAAWCQAAHLDVRWWQGAGTSAHEQALLCDTHHPYADTHGWTGRITNGHVTWHPPHRKDRHDREFSGPDPPAPP